jgi:tetratricopeptide (TPR) repeat protein
VRLYVLLAQALRAQGNLDAALAALQSAGAHADPVLVTERGVILAAQGDALGAAAAWRHVLSGDPVHPVAFTQLAALTLRTGDVATGQWLVDAALASTRAHPDVLLRATQLALATEAEGIARASRVGDLCRRLLAMVPAQPWALLALAKSQALLGEVDEARAGLASIERAAPNSAPAAEAQAARLAIDDPATHLEVQRMLRAAQQSADGELEGVVARARRVATLHASWLAWVAAAIAERRRGRWVAARGALEVALEIAPGAALAHVELSEALLRLDDPARALEHATRALALEGESPRGMSARARALEAAGRMPEAREAAARALAMQPESREARELVERLCAPAPARHWSARLREMFGRRRR